MNVCLRIETPDGAFLAHYSDVGLAALDFPSRDTALITEDFEPPVERIHDWHTLASEAVRQILSAQVPCILPPLDLAQGTDFQRSVWRQLLGIPLGQVRSYSEVAGNLGNPGATRAVGSACGANPIPVIIPCHRVLAAGRKIGGFSGGLDWKHKLLAREGIKLSPDRASASPHTIHPELFVAI